MAKTIKLRKQPWRLVCSEEIIRPKKPKHLQAVTTHLQPFAYETMSEALAAGSYCELQGERCGKSKELAELYIGDIARCFNAEEYISRDAPRFKDVFEGLKKTKELLDDCIGHLESIDDMALDQLEWAMLRGTTDSAREMVSSHTTITNGKLELKKLAAGAQIAIDNLTSWARTENHGLTDKGGRTNYWYQTVGHPRWGLVYSGFELYDIFNPDEATSTFRGRFHEFVDDLFEYATGKEGTSHAKLDAWIKEIVPPYREDKCLKEEHARLDSEWDALCFNENPRAADQSRMLEIKNAQSEIRQRRYDLWQRMWPHWRFPRIPH